MFLFWGRFFDDISDGFFCSKKHDFVEEMKPNEFYFMFCWEKFQFFFLGAWFIETGTCASGCSCTCRGHSAKQLFFLFQKNL